MIRRLEELPECELNQRNMEIIWNQHQPRGPPENMRALMKKWMKSSVNSKSNLQVALFIFYPKGQFTIGPQL